MLRYFRYLVLALLAIGLVVIALANRNFVSVQVLPDGIAQYAGFNLVLQLPLFLVVIGGVLFGLLIGFVWEWMRESRMRGEGTKAKRDAARLEREVKRLKTTPEQTDDVLALLDDGGKAG